MIQKKREIIECVTCFSVGLVNLLCLHFPQVELLIPSITILQEPVPNVVARPSPNDILEWRE